MGKIICGAHGGGKMSKICQSILSAIREITEEGRTSLDDIDRSIHKLTDYMWSEGRQEKTGAGCTVK